MTWIRMWECIGELHAWRTPGYEYNCFDSYTFAYCDECGDKGCISVECEASRRMYLKDLND